MDRLSEGVRFFDLHRFVMLPCLPMIPAHLSRSKGSALSVYMAVCSLGGPTNVTIDGVTQVVNLYNSAYDCTSGQACDAKVVSVPDMAYGTHTVSVTDAAVAQEFSTSWSFFSKIEWVIRIYV